MPKEPLPASGGRSLGRGKLDGRTNRIDMRLTAAERDALVAKALATRRTVTSIMAQLIDEMDKIIP